MQEKIQATVEDINKVREEIKRLNEVEQRLIGRLITLQELDKEDVETIEEKE